MTEDDRQRRALRRYALIDPVVDRSLDRHFRRLGKSRAQLQVVQPKPRRQFAKTARNALWQTDLCILPLYAHDEYGEIKPVVVAAMLDDATRLRLHIEAHLTQDAGVVESCFKKAALKHGLPLAVFFDNGSQFVCEQFTGALEALGVRALRARPGSPESKGKVERVFQTLQTSLLPELKALGGTLSLVDVNRYLAAWVEKYHGTVHRELPRETPTPGERWQADPTPLRQADPVRLEAAFLLKAQRRVGRTQLVEMGGRREPLAAQIGSTKVSGLGSGIVGANNLPRRPDALCLLVPQRIVALLT